MKRALILSLPFAALSLPCFAQDLRPAEPSVLYFVSVPFGGESRRDREPRVGFALQGRRAYQSLRMDTRIFDFVGSGVVEAKFLIVGAVAAGAAIAMTGKDKSVETQQAQQAQAVQQAASGGCPATPGCFAFRPDWPR
jgi:hypothetical protein